MKTEPYRVLTNAKNVLYRGDTYVALLRVGDAQRVADDFNEVMRERDDARQEAANLLNERNAALLKLEPNPRQQGADFYDAASAVGSALQKLSPGERLLVLAECLSNEAQELNTPQ